MATPVVVSDERLSNLGSQWLASRYQLGAVRAHGTLCVVYDGHDAVLRRPVVIKVSPLELADAYREALAATGRLSYPVFLAVYDVIEQDDRLFIVEESIEGRPLADYLAEGAPARRAVSLGLQLARAIAYAHMHDLAHGDLTPAAILVDRSAVAHINNMRMPPDWDYFSAISASVALSGLAPSTEASLTELRADERLRDVWAVVALLWGLVTRVSGEADAASGVASREYRDDVLPEVRSVIARVLDVGHAQRLITADALALALESLDETLTHGASGAHQTIPLAVRAYREAREGAAQYGGDAIGIRRMLVSRGDESHDLTTNSGVTDPIAIDTSQTRPADDALYAASARQRYGPSPYSGYAEAPGVDAWGNPLPYGGAAYEQVAWPGAVPVTQADNGVMKPWVWTLIGIALFVAFFLVGFLVSPQFKIF